MFVGYRGGHGTDAVTVINNSRELNIFPNSALISEVSCRSNWGGAGGGGGRGEPERGGTRPACGQVRGRAAAHVVRSGPSLFAVRRPAAGAARARWIAGRVCKGAAWPGTGGAGGRRGRQGKAGPGQGVCRYSRPGRSGHVRERRASGARPQARRRAPL